jgi:hypothetical protein
VTLRRIVQYTRHVDPDAVIFVLKIVREKGIGHEMEPMKTHAGLLARWYYYHASIGALKNHAREE